MALILIVDDNKTSLKVLELILKKYGYDVVAAKSSEEAFDFLKKNKIDLILCDILMPKIGGYEFCEKLKSDENYKNIPLIFMSNLCEPEDITKGFQSGAVDYISKPFNTKEVKSRVYNQIKIHFLQEELRQANSLLNNRIQNQVKQIADLQMETIFSVAKLAQSRDDDTGSHLERVQTFCRLMAEQMKNEPEYRDKVDNDFITNIIHTSPLHDIGKVGISDLILLKPGKLTNEEFEIMKTHSQIGSDTLVEVNQKFGNNKFIEMGIVISRHHHERWDAKGYPDKLGGEEIPLASRIMSIADVYDALKSKRAYKDAFDHFKCIQIINEGKGTQFDPGLVEIFNKVSDSFLRAWTRLSEDSHSIIT